jgi:hemolysin D
MSTNVTRLRHTALDLEFLPKALSIIETPPSPIRLRLMQTIAAVFVVSGAIGWFGRIDIVAEAQGKIQPSGRVKLVQALEIGRVVSNLAPNGGKVKAGDVLIQLDASEAAAEEAETARTAASYAADAARRNAAVTAALAGKTTADVAWPDVVPADLRAREQAVLSGDLAHLATTLSSLDAQYEQKQAEVARLEATIVSQTSLVAVQQERIDMRTILVQHETGSKASLIDARESRLVQATQLETQKGQLAEAKANLNVLDQNRLKELNAFVAEQRQKMADSSRQADDLGQKLAKARAKADHMTIRAPISGTVTASSVVNPGQVLQAGEEIMRIVPDDAGLEIEAYVQNRDIGFVRDGDKAEVKIESFPFTRYGTVPATVTRVASDAIPEADASQAEGAPGRAFRQTSAAGGQRLQNLVYQVALAPSATSITADGRNIPLSPGMSVTVEIKTGSRRILDYLISPIIETSTSSMRER